MNRFLIASIVLVFLVIGDKPTLSHTVFANPDKQAIDAAAEEVATAANKLYALEALQGIVSDPARKLDARRYGLKKIRELATEYKLFESKRFFMSIAESINVDDFPVQVRSDAFLEYSKLLVYQHADSETQNQVLRRLLAVEFQGKRAPRVRRWAAVELCDRGLGIHLDAMHEAFRAYRSSSAEEELELCKTKIEILQAEPDRISALEQALRWAGPISKLNELHRWAISELADIPGERSEWILLRYALEKRESEELADSSKRRAAVVGLVEKGWTAKRLVDAGIPPTVAYFVGAEIE